MAETLHTGDDAFDDTADASSVNSLDTYYDGQAGEQPLISPEQQELLELIEDGYITPAEAAIELQKLENRS